MSRRRITETDSGGATGAEATDHRREPSRAMLLRLLRLLKDNPLPPIIAADLRSVGPTHACTCGCTVFSTYVQFEDYEICWYALDVQCANCGNLLKAPCPVDKPEFEQ